MTNRMIENRVMKIQDLEQQKAKLDAEIKKIQDELKADLEEKGVEVVKTDKGITVRWQEISQSRFDSSAFKKACPEQYGLFMKPIVSHRFSYSA